MIFQVSLFSIIAYIILLWVHRKSIVQLQLSFIAVFLTGTAIVGELDVLLPIYFVFSFLPILPKIRTISRFTMFFSLYVLVYLVIGLISQNPTATLVTFIAKLWQFIILFIILDSRIEVDDIDYKKAIWTAIIVETILGIYLIFTSDMVDKISGLVRLVSNSQPITGNIATCSLPISALFYRRFREDKRRVRFVLLANLYLLVWIILSGTRGYILEYVAVMGLIFYDYFTNKEVGKRSFINRFFVVITLLVVAICLVVVLPGLIEKASSVLRINQSVGIRSYENRIIRDFAKNGSIQEVLFGIGLGAKASSHEAFLTAFRKQFDLGMWHQDTYMNGHGALFHSLYSNVVLCLGLIGMFVMIVLFVKLWKKINLYCAKDANVRRFMHSFQVAFFVMNYYRWSAVCGIGEMIILALVLKSIRHDEGIQSEQILLQKTLVEVDR